MSIYFEIKYRNAEGEKEGQTFGPDYRLSKNDYTISVTNLDYPLKPPENLKQAVMEAKKLKCFHFPNSDEKEMLEKLLVGKECPFNRPKISPGYYQKGKILEYTDIAYIALDIFRIDISRSKFKSELQSIRKKILARINYDFKLDIMAEKDKNDCTIQIRVDVNDDKIEYLSFEIPGHIAKELGRNLLHAKEFLLSSEEVEIK
jgi:hypothetical protein